MSTLSLLTFLKIWLFLQRINKKDSHEKGFDQGGETLCG